jgi:serine protease AprX
MSCDLRYLYPIRKVLTIIGLILSFACSGQEGYWVFLKDKHNVTFDPYTYFDSKAIERRIRENISLTDSSDFPLNQSYVEVVHSLSDSVCGQSRWFNAVACELFPDQVWKIEALDFVKEVRAMGWAANTCAFENALPFSKRSEELNILKAQTKRMGADLLWEKGYTGKGVRIAIFDVGFSGLKEDLAFKDILANEQIRATYDFVNDKKYVFDYNSHGTTVMSCIGGVYNDIPMGCAKDAEFVLARTEVSRFEWKIREERWVLSLEWADKWGADIVNSSLGYAFQLYFPHQMDGKSSIISIAANLAFSKGILVVNSAGNEGTSYWEVICAPGDADSVLTVGGIDPWQGYHNDFSSYGPTSDLRMKPNVCSFGWAAVSHATQFELASGTSFASPLVAGFAACIRQMHPDWTVEQLFHEIQCSGDLAPYYDYAHGFGVPNAQYFLKSDSLPLPTFRAYYAYSTGQFKFEPLKDFKESDSFEKIKKDFLSDKKYERRLPYLYIHFEDKNGMLVKYKVIEPGKDILGYFSADEIECETCPVRIHYKGYTMVTTKKELQKLKK